jgi:hypothetical protein
MLSKRRDPYIGLHARYETKYMNVDGTGACNLHSSARNQKRVLIVVMVIRVHFTFAPSDSWRRKFDGHRLSDFDDEDGF